MPSRLVSSSLVVFVLVGLLSTAGCATFSGGLPQEEGLHPRLTPYAYLEEGTEVSLAVDTEATRWREEAPFIPLAVGVANIDLHKMTITRESFTLVDEAGRRYPLATVQELRESRPRMAMDYRLGEYFLGVFAGRWDVWPLMPAVFFPFPTVNPRLQDKALLRDRVELPRHSWMYDMLYFPHPEGKLVGQRYTLLFKCEEFAHPLVLNFTVRD